MQRVQTKFRDKDTTLTKLMSLSPKLSEAFDGRYRAWYLSAKGVQRDQRNYLSQIISQEFMYVDWDLAKRSSAGCSGKQYFFREASQVHTSPTGETVSIDGYADPVIVRFRYSRYVLPNLREVFYEGFGPHLDLGRPTHAKDDFHFESGLEHRLLSLITEDKTWIHTKRPITSISLFGGLRSLLGHLKRRLG